MTLSLLLAAVVVIRTFNYANVPATDLANARATADRTFQQAGISLEWIDCSVRPDEKRSSNDRRSCATPLRDGSEFMLRLMSSALAAPRTSSRALAMGASLIDHVSGVGALATVDPERTSAVAQETATDYGTLLGRAIAHEIGHLLLGHPRHSRSGLMRALWSQDELRGLRPAGWQFSPDEGAQMRQALAVRARAAN